LETINNAQSKIIASYHDGVLIGNDYLITQLYSDDKYLTFNMLRSPTVEKPELLDGTRWIMTGQEFVDFLDDGQETEQEIENGSNTIATTNGIIKWITTLNREELLSKTDYLETVNSVAKTYLTQTNAENSCATLIVTGGLQTVITSVQGEVTTLQNELVALGIGQLVNSLFSFIDNIVSDAALSAQIAKCFKLTGTQTLTGNISASSDTYTFMGAKPSEIT